MRPFAASILALGDKAIAQQFEKFRSKQQETVLRIPTPCMTQHRSAHWDSGLAAWR